MWRVTQPQVTAAESFRKCISRVRDPQLKNRLQASEAEVLTAGRSYAEAADTTRLHTLDPVDFELGSVTNSEMVRVYTSRMAKKGAAGRRIYDDLILAAKNGRCPLCGQRPVSTLDHHLPKTLYPALAVDPLNLVPACADCNKLKLDIAFLSAEEETLHPYFDDIENQSWLSAEVMETTPAALRFFVAPPAEWDATLTQRVRSHFKRFRLGALYASQAAQELSNINYRLTQLYAAEEAHGEDRVRDYLAEEAESRRRAHLNSWQTATYVALAASPWFCNKGFVF